MISLEEVEQSILELESMDTSFAVCSKLSDLYIVRQHLKGYAENAPQTLDVEGNSEITSIIYGKNQNAVWAVISELMDSVELLYPKLYNATIQKLKDI